MIESWKKKIKESPRLKKLIIQVIEHNSRPRWWIRTLAHPFLIKRGKKSVIRRYVRKDIFPYNPMFLGAGSVIEDFSTINNGVGEIVIGNHSRIGLGCTVIGPVKIGNHVQLAQGIVVSGLNHNYVNIDVPIDLQGVSTCLITIDDDVWIGANSVICAGVTIGKHCIVGGGSVVTRDIPPYTVCVGNPAKPIKKYDFEKQQWISVKEGQK